MGVKHFAMIISLSLFFSLCFAGCGSRRHNISNEAIISDLKDSGIEVLVFYNTVNFSSIIFTQFDIQETRTRDNEVLYTVHIAGNDTDPYARWDSINGIFQLKYEWYEEGWDLTAVTVIEDYIEEQRTSSQSGISPKTPDSQATHKSESSYPLSDDEYEEEGSLDEYLISISTELAEEIGRKADVDQISRQASDEQLVDSATRYSSLAYEQPLHAIAFRVDISNSHIKELFTDVDLSNIDPQAGVSSLMPSILNSYYGGVVQIAVSNLLSFSAQRTSHKDFNTTRCVVVDYEGGMAVWVTFNESDIPNLLNAHVVPTMNLAAWIGDTNAESYEEAYADVELMFEDFKHYHLGNNEWEK